MVARQRGRQTDRQRRAARHRLADSNLSSAQRSFIHRAERASAAGNGVFGPAAPTLFTFTLALCDWRGELLRGTEALRLGAPHSQRARRDRTEITFSAARLAGVAALLFSLRSLIKLCRSNRVQVCLSLTAKTVEQPHQCPNDPPPPSLPVRRSRPPCRSAP